MNEPGSAMRRTLLSRSAFIFAIRLFPIAATAAAGIACSHLLPTALNGIYAKLWIVYIAVFVAIAGCGLAPLMLTHTAGAVDAWLRSVKSREVEIFSAWLSGFSVLLVALFFRQDAFSPYVAAALFFVQVGILLAETYLIIHEKFVPALIGSFLYAVVFGFVHYLFLKGAFTLTGLFWMIALIGAVRLSALSVIARNVFKQSALLIPAEAMPPAIKKQWLQLGIYDTSQVLFRWVDKLIISLIVGPALFAIYLNGTQDVPFMATLLSAVGNSLLQQMAIGERSTEARLKLVNLTGSLLARIVFPVFFFLFFFRQEFIVFIWSGKYAASVPLFAVSILALPLRAYNYTSILQHLNSVKIINWGALLDLSIALSLSYPLYLWKGLPGVVFAFMISSYIQAGFYLFQTSRLLHCSILQLIPWKAWATMLIVFGFAFIGLHEVLASHLPLKQTLFLGFAGMVAVIVAALAPVVFSKKAHG